MRNGDTDYKSKLAAARRASPNSYVEGVQSVMEEGAGTAIENTRGKYGDTSLKTNQVMQGANSNFQQTDTPGNQVLDDLPNQTGSIQTQVSSTNVPEEDPETMETNRLEQRLAKMAYGGQGFSGLNNRNREV